MSLAVKNPESPLMSKRGVGGRARDQSWSEMKSWPNFTRRENILVCDDEMLMFEGRDRPEKSERARHTCCVRLLSKVV